MLWIGLTGGIATGKSEVSRYLNSKGVPLIDADKIARDVVEPGAEAYSKMLIAFGPGYLLNDGGEPRSWDRAKLGQLVFNDVKAKEKLEQIVHPAIQKRVAELRKAIEATGALFCVYDMPLLFEKKAQDSFDKTVLVYTTRDQQIARLMSRNGYSKKEAEVRIASQMDIDTKRDHADYIIDNTKDFLHLHAQVDLFLSAIHKEVGQQ